MQEFVYVIAAAVIEWRRSDQAERLALLDARLAAVEGLGERVAAVEASIERLRRNL